MGARAFSFAFDKSCASVPFARFIIELSQCLRRFSQIAVLKRDFHADKPLEKCVTDITEIKAKDGKLYVSAILDCFDLTVLGLAMDTNMGAQLCVRTLRGAAAAYRMKLEAMKRQGT